MRSDAADFAVINDDDTVAVHNGRDSLGDDDFRDAVKLVFP